MDISKDYVKMCKEAGLPWNPNVGDYCLAVHGYSKYDFRYEDDNGVLGVIIKIDKDVFAIEPVDKGATAWYSVAYSIFLPRQDQLQAMMPDTDTYRMFNKLYAFGETAYPFRSGEQLTLAYVMRLNFGKEWDGSAWVTASRSSPA